MTAINRHMSFNRQVTVTPGLSRHGDNYPLKLMIHIRNRTGIDVVLTSHYFKIGSTVRPHPNASGSPARGEFEVKFPDTQGHLSLFKYLLPAGDSVSTWMPIDPSHTNDELQAAISNASCGTWRYECQWLTEDYCCRKFEQNL